MGKSHLVANEQRMQPALKPASSILGIAADRRTCFLRSPGLLQIKDGALVRLKKVFVSGISSSARGVSYEGGTILFSVVRDSSTVCLSILLQDRSLN